LLNETEINAAVVILLTHAMNSRW